jgi:hypothetical protein
VISLCEKAHRTNAISGQDGRCRNREETRRETA